MLSSVIAALYHSSSVVGFMSIAFSNSVDVNPFPNIWNAASPVILALAINSLNFAAYVGKLICFFPFMVALCCKLSSFVYAPPLGSTSSQSLRKSCLNNSQSSSAAFIVTPSTTLWGNARISASLFLFHCEASPDILFRAVKIRNLSEFIRSGFISKKISRSSMNACDSILLPLNSGNSPMMLGNLGSLSGVAIVRVGLGVRGGDGSLRGGGGGSLCGFGSVVSKNSSSVPFGLEGPGSGLVGCLAGVGVVPTEVSLKLVSCSGF